VDAILGIGSGQDLVTEDEWLTENHPFYMLTRWEYYRGKPSARKRRLLACAACRLIWYLMPEDHLRQAIESAEAYTDGLISEAELIPLQEKAHALGLARGEVLGHMSKNMPGWDAQANGWRAAHSAADAAGPDDGPFGNAMHHAAQDGGSGIDTVDPGQAALIRDILGSPLRKPVIQPDWRTSNVMAIARSIHSENAFDLMPILADALQDAGCDSPDVLEHCRGDGPHVKGCWVIDLILERE
jgi:hypothetical protein